MNQVATRAGGAIASLQDLKSGLSNVAATLPKAGGDPILRLLQDGTWLYGAENVEVEEGSRWAINPMSLQHGYISWTDYDKSDKRSNEIVGEAMVPFNQPLPGRHDLPNTGWDWTEQVSMNAKCLNGEDEGTQVVYSPTSVGGIRAVKELIAAILKQLDIDENRPVPVVELDTDHYNHKKYGKTYVPVLRIVDWLSMDGPDEAEETEAAPKKEAKPARGRKAAAKEENAAPEEETGPAPETDSEQTSSPVRRRRRR